MGIDDKAVYNSVSIAKYIVAYANMHNYSINITKVQKLLYIAYGLYLAVKNERLVDEHPQAWPYGPVFPTTRKKLVKIKDLNTITFSSTDNYNNDQDLKSLIELTFNSFGRYSAGALSNWSHQDGSPWQKTVSDPSFEWGGEILDEYIKSYFSNMIPKNGAN